MPLAPAVIATIAATAVAGSAAIYQGVEANQQTQHAKGAAQAQQTALDAQTKSANDATTANQKQQADTGSATQASALAALRASMSASSGAGGSILTGPQGTGNTAPIQTKTLLGA